MKIPSGQETLNYFIDQQHLEDYDLLISAVKTNQMPKTDIFKRRGQNTNRATYFKTNKFTNLKLNICLMFDPLFKAKVTT